MGIKVIKNRHREPGVLRAGAELLLIKSPMNSSPKAAKPFAGIRQRRRPGVSRESVDGPMLSDKQGWYRAFCAPISTQVERGVFSLKNADACSIKEIQSIYRIKEKDV